MSVRVSCTGYGLLMLAGVSISLGGKDARALLRVLERVTTGKRQRAADVAAMLPYIEQLQQPLRDYPCDTLKQAKRLYQLRESFSRDLCRSL